MRHALGALAAAMLTAVACSLGDQTTCIGTLPEVGQSCPKTFDGTEAMLPPCPSSASITQAVWRCPDLIALAPDGGRVASVCYYDASSHALVGAERFAADMSFCGDSTFSIEAGRISPLCRENAPAVTRACAAGADQ